MADEESPEVHMRDFVGMTSNMNPHNLQPGAMVSQVNLLVRRPGELVARGGLREQQGDSE